MSFFVEELVKNNILSADQAGLIDGETRNSSKKEEEIIIDKNFIAEDDLFQKKADILGFNLKKITPTDVPLKVLEIIPEETAKNYKFIAVREGEGFIEIGMVYPEDLKAQEALRFLGREKGFSYQIFLISLSNFNNILKRYKGLKQEVSKALGELETEIKEEEKGKKRTSSEIEQMAEEAPIARIVAVIMRNAVEGKASDIHIELVKDKVRVRFRQDGVLHSSLFLPKDVHAAIVARIKILANLKIDESRVPQDGRFALSFGEKKIDFRVSTFPTAEGESVALRVLDPEEGLKTIKDLGLEGIGLKLVEEAIEKPYGMILVTGPTGSGKTTTLYAILKQVMNDEINIMTLEDPIEYVITGVNQSQAKPEIGYTFASGLRSMLRHDPDVIMVGEIRDHETADLAVHSALTGHIVLSTLHTNDAIGAIPRFVNLGIPAFLMAPSLNLVIGQRLIRQLCQFCKEQYSPGEEIKNLYKQEIGALSPEIISGYGANFDINNMKLFRPKGCPKCNNSGYSGRRGIYEVLNITSEIGQIVENNLSEDKIKEAAIKQGMVSMRQDGLLKCLQGSTSVEEVVSTTKETEEQLNG